MWFLLSLLCALSLSVADVLSKIALHDTDIYLVSWVKVSLAFPFLVSGIFFSPIPAINRTFILICVILFPLEVLALLLYMKAIQVSPLSLTVPFLAVSPIFIVLTSYVMLHEKLDIPGLLGVLLIAIGSYLLNVDQARYGILMPFKAIFRERGSWIMIIVAVIYSITANLGKMAVNETNPLFFSIFYCGTMTMLVLPFTLFFSDRPLRRLREGFGLFIGIGLAMALMVLFHTMAIVRIEVAYMISIKRTSPIYTVLLGCMFLHEKNFGERFIGSIVMFFGVLLILL